MDTLMKLLKHLRSSDKNIEFWLDCQLYVDDGFVRSQEGEAELTRFYVKRGRLMDAIREHRYWR